MSKVWTPEAIEQFAKDHKVDIYPYVDGVYNVYGNIDLSDYYLDNADEMFREMADEEEFSRFPSIYRLYGNLDATYLQITSLVGCPRYISGHFDVSYNNITSLKGMPLFIGKDFRLDHNDLHTIDIDEDIEIIKGAFSCASNPNLRFTKSQLNALNIKGHIYMDPWQLIPDDPAEFIEKGILPI